MPRIAFCLTNLCLLFLSLPLAAAPAIQWPGEAKVAVSLSYDDALNSQLDHVVPTLDKYQIKASFYPALASPVIPARLEEWRKAALSGHELGNHTFFHPCSASKPGRTWVQPQNDLDKRTLVQIQGEVTAANTFLKAIDGRTERTYTPPCLDSDVADGNYLKVVAKEFVAIKTAEGFPEGFAVLVMPDGQSGKELIEFVKTSAKSAKLVHVLFHGVGGDHMAVTPAAHEELVKYLAENKKDYWTDTYISIMKHVKATVPGLMGTGK